MTDSGYSYLYRGPGPDTGPQDDYPAYWHQQPPPGTPRQAPPEAGPQGDYPPFWQQRPPTTQALPPQAQPPRATPREALPPQPPPGSRKSRAALAGVLVFVVTFALCGGIALASRSSGNQHPAAGKPPATGAGAGSSPTAATSAPSPVATTAPPTVSCYGTRMPADECAGAQATTWAAFIAAYPAGYSAASAAAYCSQSHPAGQPWFEGCVWDLRQDSATHAAAAPPQPASGPTTAAPPAPAPAQSAAAASCTKTAEGNCIKKGQFCSDADHNQNGTDAEGETLTCEQAGSRWYWES